jgi:hypothetical protein
MKKKQFWAILIWLVEEKKYASRAGFWLPFGEDKNCYGNRLSNRLFGRELRGVFNPHCRTAIPEEAATEGQTRQ